MHNDTPHWETILDQGKHNAIELLATVKQERAALALKDADAIGKCLHRKREICAELEVIWRTLTAKLSLTGHTGNKQGLLDYIKQQSSAAAKKDTDEFITLLEKCDNENKINGSIINLSMRKVNQALSVLFRCQRQTHTYDKGGHCVTRNTLLTNISA